ncbi:unnamed protein product [Paramecium primaurelia]|uniref:Uncharacterized protein n=1 Tax=Paramecium primaurelia TaxID=5886 RepID=A0A8S1PRK0_PARPR|nr:unnamed protein product [Paramecium primaurelia]
MIEFAKLSKQEKEKYIKFLVDNKIEFQQSDQGFTASFKVQNKENVDPTRKSIEQIKRASPHQRTPTRSVSPLRRKFTREDAINLIQEIYSKKFDDASKQLKLKNVVNEDFGVYVMRFAQNKQIDIKDCMQIQDENVFLFKKFLQKEYEEEDLMYYLFLRAIVEKEIGQSIYQSRKSLDLQKQYLSICQVQSIISTVYENQVDEVQELLEYFKNHFDNNKISAFDFMALALEKYNNDRKPQDKKILINEQVINELQRFFYQEVEECTEQLFDQVKLIVNDLLQSIFRQDKRIWINRVQNAKPEDVLYLEGLQKQFKSLSANKQDIKLFSRKILQTPQLSRCFGKLLE